MQGSYRFGNAVWLNLDEHVAWKPQDIETFHKPNSKWSFILFVTSHGSMFRGC